MIPSLLRQNEWDLSPQVALAVDSATAGRKSLPLPFQLATRVLIERMLTSYLYSDLKLQSTPMLIWLPLRPSWPAELLKTNYLPPPLPPPSGLCPLRRPQSIKSKPNACRGDHQVLLYQMLQEEEEETRWKGRIAQVR